MHAPEERFQLGLFEFIKLHRPTVVVETGVSEGVSSKLILQAMDSNKLGALHSIEVFCEQPFKHPRWTFHKGSSGALLEKVLTDVASCDIFLHDSDHAFGCQTFEFELAMKYVKRGGFIITDDFEWGNPPHGAWDIFLNRHKLGPAQDMGSARFVQVL